MRRFLFVATLIALAALVSPGVGISADIPDRIKSQQERIDQGIRSGELNQKEADIVQDNLNRIKGRYERMKADKKLTDQEQDKLGKMLEKNDQMIRDRKGQSLKLM